jgi:hypothetical protein
MARKRRRQIYSDPQQDAALRRQAAQTNSSEAEIIRQAIDNRTRILRHPANALEAWQRERDFIRLLMEQGPLASGRTWPRENPHDR